jgi:hypothetical protein
MREELRIDLVEGAEVARLFKGRIGTYHYLGYQQAKGAQVSYLPNREPNSVQQSNLRVFLYSQHLAQ